MRRPTEPGWYDVFDLNCNLLGKFLVEYGSASGLHCKVLKMGGSIHCPGYTDWNRYTTSWHKYE